MSFPGDLPHQIELANFPSGVQVTSFSEGAGTVLRAEQSGRAVEVLLTDEARKMYGDGPSVSVALKTLRSALERGEAGRLVFEGD